METMYKSLLITIGKSKSGPLQDMTAEYLKRLGPHMKWSTREVVETPFRDVSQRSQILKEEAKRIREAVPEDAYLIILEASGKTFDSEAFAKQVDRWSENGSRTLAFVLGGPLGIDDVLKQEADVLLSLSVLTMPHDLARVVLLEQLYRAMTILNRKTYHY